MYLTIPEVYTPSQISKMATDLQAFLSSDIGFVLQNAFETERKTAIESMRGTISKGEYNKAHTHEGTLQALDNIVSDEKLFPGLLSVLTRECDKRKVGIKKIDRYLEGH